MLQKFLLNLVLTPEQQNISTKIPIFTILVWIFGVANHLNSIYYEEFCLLVFLTIIHLISFTLISLLISVPLEIHHGTKNLATIHLFSWIYSFLVGRIIRDEFKNFHFLDIIIGYTVVGCHVANIFRNPNFVAQKWMRLLIILGLTFGYDVAFLIDRIKKGDWSIYLYGMTCHVSGLLAGFLAGWFWIYNVDFDAEKLGDKWRNCGVSLTILVGFLICVEFSGLHLIEEDHPPQY